MKRPMLAATLTSLDQVRLPAIVMPKLDGVRCCIVQGRAYTRNGKVIPNKYIRNTLETMCRGLKVDIEGEIIYKLGLKGEFNNAQSMVMSETSIPPEHWSVMWFDLISDEIFIKRYARLKRLFKNIIPQRIVNSIDGLVAAEQKAQELHAEGIIIRDPYGSYKHGRSTIKEQGLMKYKRWHDCEAIIIDIEPLNKNTNALETDELGRAKRSSKKSGMVQLEAVGAFICMDCETQQKIRVASGLTSEQRKTYWAIKAHLLGETLTYKYQERTETGAPRFPIFIGIRPE